jgi:hypothetical protein
MKINPPIQQNYTFMGGSQQVNTILVYLKNNAGSTKETWRV